MCTAGVCVCGQCVWVGFSWICVNIFCWQRNSALYSNSYEKWVQINTSLDLSDWIKSFCFSVCLHIWGFKRSLTNSEAKGCVVNIIIGSWMDPKVSKTISHHISELHQLPLFGQSVMMGHSWITVCCVLLTVWWHTKHLIFQFSIEGFVHFLSVLTQKEFHPRLWQS